MANKKLKNSGVSGIMLFAKAPGRTSFSSLSTIKKALGTSKVGHTGTLDSFADGLLVVLVGSLTRLVPHITGFDKTYLALVEFGRETDTLDPTGTVVKTAPVPTEEAVRAVLPQFTGDIMQVPPAFSALHVGGKRASDLVRSGGAVELPARPLHIYRLDLLDFAGKYALLEVRCSKGTYIRALARDIAAACGSCAHLAALRRVAVGPFSLREAAGSGLLGDFTIGTLTARPLQESDKAPGEPDSAEVRAALQPMTAPLAEYCGFVPVELSAAGAQAFANGRPLKRSCFYYPAYEPLLSGAELAVFAPPPAGADGTNGAFCGVVEQHGTRLGYGFVIPHKPPFAVYSWEQVTGGRFNTAWREQGTALTIGSFDGPHFGHESLFAAVCAQKQLVPGVITFTRSLRGLKDPAGYAGDVATLSQRLSAFAEKGFSFAVVIDFTDDFAHLPGADFLSALLTGCGMRFLAEGNDFHCGYRGATDVAAIMDISKAGGFDFAAIAPVLHEGEKISSSRIRAALLSGDVTEAAAMLNHAFSLDCAGWRWEPDGDALSAVVRRGQLLPKDGSYCVNVLLSFSTASAQCTVGGRTVRLSGAALASSGCVRSVCFL